MPHNWPSIFQSAIQSPISKSGAAMSFKDNLLTKIKIDKLANKVIASIGPAESGRKADKDAIYRGCQVSGV